MFEGRLREYVSSTTSLVMVRQEAELSGGVYGCLGDLTWCFVKKEYRSAVVDFGVAGLGFEENKNKISKLVHKS